MDSTFLRNPQLEGDTFFWPAGNTSALLLHGFTATTAEVRLLAKFLHDRGLTVSGPLLPGHGTSPDDMNRCKWQDWADAIERDYAQLHINYERIFICGESMGAVLSLYLASKHPEIAGVILYSPALLVTMKNVLLTRVIAPLLAPFVPYVAKSQKAPNDSDARWKGYTVNPAHAAIQLSRLQDETRKRLGLVHQPTLVIQGRLDDTIDPGSGDVILRGIASTVKEIHWLENSTHCIILDKEWDKAAELTLEFIQRV